MKRVGYLYLRRTYRLEILKIKTKKEAKLLHSWIVMHSKRPSDRNRTKRLMEEWFRIRAKVKLLKIANDCINRVGKQTGEPNAIYMRKMKTRWGSCSAVNGLTLNTELIKAPTPCIEYVIIHELYHLKERNHSQAFYIFQERLMPDWMKWKERLETFLS